MNTESTPFDEAHWSREEFLYKGMPAYWDEDHPSRLFWIDSTIAEKKYSNLIKNGTIEVWSSFDEKELGLEDLDEIKDADLIEVLEFRRGHYHIELEDLIIRLPDSQGGSIQGVDRCEVFEWAGIDPSDIIQSEKYQNIPL